MARTTAPKTLDVALTAEREKRGHTQEQAAATIGVRQATWNRWELGQSADPDPDYYDALMSYLKLDEPTFAWMLVRTRRLWQSRRTRPRQMPQPR